MALHCRKEELRGLLTSVRDLRQQVGGKDDSANEANGESGLHKSVRPRPPLSHTRAHKRTRTYEVMAPGVQARGVAAARTDWRVVLAHRCAQMPSIGNPLAAATQGGLPWLRSAASAARCNTQQIAYTE